MLRLRTLGRIRLMDSNGVELLAGHRKELVLLAYLTRRSGQSASRGELADLLWGDREPARARHSLRQALANLRFVLGSKLDTGPDEVRLFPESIETDVAELMAQLAASRLDESAVDWRAPFLADLDDLGGESFRAWLEAEREGLRRQIALSFERLLADAQRQGRWQVAVPWADHWAELQPYDERAQIELLDALLQAGRAAEALDRHRLMTVQLRDLAGAEPSARFLARGAEIERAVRAEWSRTASPGSAALFTPDLVARDHELAELLASWQSVRSGYFTVVVVEGEAGLGKTRLCRELLRRLHIEQRELCVLQARGLGHDAQPLTLVRELLTHLRAAPGLDDASNRDLALLASLAPNLREQFPHLPELPANTSALADTLARVLGVVSTQAPMVVFVDDFTSADFASQELLARLIERSRAGRVMLLLSIEAEERTGAHALAGLFGAARVRRIRLRPLDVSELEAVVASMVACPADVRAALARRLHAETSGNPLFATEMLAALVDEGRLRPDTNGLWQLTTAMDVALPLPSTIRDAVRRRLERLSEAALRLIRAAAAIEEPFDLATLGSSAGLTADQLGPATDELVARRFIHLEFAQPGVIRYRLSHALLRRIVLENGLGRQAADAPARSPERRYRRVLIAAVATAAVVGLALFTWFAFGRREAPASTFAIGLISDYTKSDSAGLANALPEMLATNLARVRALRVVSHARLYEIIAQLGERNVASATLADAARRAGAQQLVEGELYATAGSGYRLDLRRVALADGSVQTALRVHGRDVFALVDEATARIAADFGVESEALHLADVTTQSPVAYRLYEEGLRGYYEGDMIRAGALFRAALREDSTFVLPAYYFVLAQRTAPLAYDSAIEALLIRHADHAPERERLLMRARLSFLANDPAAVAVAETLTIRYPDEPEGHLLLGQTLTFAGKYMRALPHLNHVIATDSLAFRRISAGCRACEAFDAMVNAYASADSNAAAERAAREWARLQPGAAQSWSKLAHFLETQGRINEALAARRHAAAFEPGQTYDYIFPGILAIRAGDFAAADASLRQHSLSAARELQSNALWFLVISLRYQGRFAEALEQARRFRAVQEGEATYHLMEAQVLFEMGRPREAAAIFRQLADAPRNSVFDRSRGARARQRSWLLTQAATALAAAGDTSQLAMLADSIQVAGAQSLLARDTKLHYYVRGLLLAAREKHADAATSFRSATDWPLVPSSPFNRINFELGRELIKLGRTREAIRPLQLAFVGPLEASWYYLSRSEVHALLGRAFEAVGQRDSAIAHYRWTMNAWRNADPLLTVRRDSIRARLAALEHAP